MVWESAISSLPLHVWERKLVGLIGSFVLALGERVRMVCGLCSHSQRCSSPGREDSLFPTQLPSSTLSPHTFSTLYPVLQLMTTWSLKVYLAWEGSIFPLIGGCTSGQGFPLNKEQMKKNKTHLNKRRKWRVPALPPSPCSRVSVSLPCSCTYTNMAQPGSSPRRKGRSRSFPQSWAAPGFGHYKTGS